jgi:hypothetical protein
LAAEGVAGGEVERGAVFAAQFNSVEIAGWTFGRRGEKVKWEEEK